MRPGASFLQAYALKKHPAVLLNLAWSCLKSGHAMEAEKNFKLFLSEGKDITDKQRADANDGLNQSHSKLGRIEVSAVPGTEVTVDGEKYYFDLVAEPLRDPNGTIQGLTCSATDITSAKKNLLERERLIAQLQEALEEVKLLSGLLSICASCKRIMNEHEVWEPLESYIQSHSQAKFSHGVCPDCLQKLYPEHYSKK